MPWGYFIKYGTFLVIVLFLVCTSGLAFTYWLRRYRPQAPLTARAKRLEPVLAGGFALAFVLFFAFGMGSSYMGMSRRGREVEDKMREEYQRQQQRQEPSPRKQGQEQRQVQKPGEDQGQPQEPR
jgi:flagellar biosynthesis/type III secretory pathway M-ring protein FliF/YscJ